MSECHAEQGTSDCRGAHDGRPRDVQPDPRRTGGFTLIELAVVTVLLAVLGMVLLPVMTRASHHEDLPACAPNLRLIGIASAQFAADQDGRLPHIGDLFWNPSITYILVDRRVAEGGPYEGMIGAYTNLELLIADGYLGNRAALHCPLNRQVAFQDSRGDVQHINFAFYLDRRLRVEGGYRNMRSSFLRQSLPESDEHAWEGALVDSHPEKAWLADVFSTPERVLESHGDSVNVLYGTGSVRRTAYDPFEPPFNVPQYGNPATYELVWDVLDQN